MTQDAFVIINSHLRVEHLVSPSEIPQQLVAAILETRKVGVSRIKHVVNPLQAGRIFLEIEAGQINFLVLFGEGHVAKEALSETDRDRWLPPFADDPIVPP